MEVTSGAEEGFVREWTPCSHILNLIPPRIQTGLFSNELCLTCVDAVSEYLALGTNVGLVYWYDRKKGNIQRLRCEASTSPITYVKIVNTVDYMVGAGNAAGQVTVFQIPKEHPENVPDTFKPKVEPKVERYTIGDLHKSKITAIEWSKNGMRLFSGDKDGVIIMTEIDFYMHLCKSMEIVNEQHEIVQLSYCQGALLVSSVYRCIVCERRDARWHVSQLGKKERRSLCALGATFQYSYARGGGGAAPAAYCARPGLRLWRADRSGEVLQTLLFKEAISNPLTVAELLNPAAGARGGVKGAERERQLGALHVFRDQFLVAHDEGSLYILDPRSLTAVAVVDDLRRILSVSVNKDEIFVLEGPRSLVRLAHAPEPAALAPEEPGSLMSKSLQHSLAAVAAVSAAVSSVRQQLPRDLLDHADQLGVLSRSETPDTGAVSNAEECFELPPVRQLPAELAGTVLQSIVAEFRDVAGDVSGDVSDADELRRARALELHRKLKMYDSIMERKREGEVIHSSRRSRRREPAGGEGGATPRRPRSASHTGAALPAPPAPPAAPALTDYGDVTRSGMQENDDLLEQQIEEKEKILAKMLNLESLSIKSPEPAAEPDTDMYTPYEYKEVSHYNGNQPNETESEKKIPEKKIKLPEKQNQKKPPEPPSIIDLVPKVVELPNNWNLENFELRLDMKNGLRGGGIISPDDNLDSEWEVI